MMNYLAERSMSMEYFGIIADNLPEYVKTILKIWNEGGCVVPIDWRIPNSVAIELLLKCGVKQCYIDKTQAQNKPDFLKNGIELIDLANGLENAMLLPKEIYSTFENQYSNEDAVILFSSGTTGEAKGIVLSHYAIQKNADSILNYMKPEKNDCIYIMRSLAHAAGFIGEMIVGLKTGCRLLLSPTVISFKQIIKNINKYEVSILCLNASILSLLLSVSQKHQMDLGKELRAIYTMSAKTPYSLIRDAKNAFGVPVLNVYGLTELGPRVTAQTIDSNNYFPDCVGKPIKDVHIRIVDFKTKKKVPALQKGLIEVKSPCLFTRYVNKDCHYDNTKWFRTNDVGYVDSDGNVYILDRYDDMANCSGHNVFLSSIEETIMEYEGMESNICFSIKNKQFGDQIICLYITDSEDSQYEENLRKYCYLKLAPYEVPFKFIKVLKIPTNINGKRSRRSIAEQYMNGGEMNG